MEKVFRETKQEITFFDTHCLDFPAHTHEDIEVVYVQNGGGTAYCDGKKYTLVPQSFFITFPNQVHHYVNCSSGDYILLIIKPSQLLSGGAAFMQGYPSSSVWTPNNELDSHTVSLIQMALDEYRQNGYNNVIEAYLTAFFEKILRFFDIQKTSVSNDTVLRIMQYCSSHYKEDITVSDVAAELNLSKSTVSHIFSLKLGLNFCEHINSLRLIDAVYMLKNPDLSITDIANLSGFSTIRTFNRAFRKQYGISPSDYRRNPPM